MGTLSFLLLFTKIQCEENIEKTFVRTGAQKVWRTAGSGDTLPQYLPNSKNKFPVKISYLCKVSLSYWQKLTKKQKKISLKVFKIMDFKTYTKGLQKVPLDLNEKMKNFIIILTFFCFRPEILFLSVRSVKIVCLTH